MSAPVNIRGVSGESIDEPQVKAYPASQPPKLLTMPQRVSLTTTVEELGGPLCLDPM